MLAVPTLKKLRNLKQLVKRQMAYSFFLLFCLTIFRDLKLVLNGILLGEFLCSLHYRNLSPKIN